MTSPASWNTDRPLDEAIAARVIGAQFPWFKPLRVEPLGSGWCNDAYLVGGTWVFRFPRRAGAQDAVRREVAIMPIVADALDVPVPAFDLVGEASADFPYLFVGYRMLPGTRAAAVEVTPTGRPALAAQLGRLLTQTHGIEPARVPAGDETQCPAQYLAEVVQVAGAFRAAVGADEARRWEPWLRGEVEPPAAYAGPPRFTHNDLGDDHLLMDPRTGRITAVIDWADAALDDPCVDFIFANHWLGPAFIDRVLGHYALGPDAGFHDRLGFNTAATAIIWTANAHQIGDPADIRRWADWFIDVFAAGRPGWPSVPRAPKK